MFKFVYDGYSFVRQNPSVQIDTSMTAVKKDEITLPASEPAFGSDDKDDPDHVYDVFSETDILYHDKLDPITDMEKKEFDDIVAVNTKTAANAINPTTVTNVNES